MSLECAVGMVTEKQGVRAHCQEEKALDQQVNASQPDFKEKFERGIQVGP